MLRRLDTEGLTSRYHFDSLRELQTYIDNTPKAPRWHRNNLSVAASTGAKALGATWEQATAMARDGWIEGAQRTQEALKAFPPATPQPDKRTDFYGHLPHVPRYCAGAPDSMIRNDDRRSGGGKVLTLYVPVNAMWNTRAECMANFGLAVAQYINQLETDGRRVDLYGAICSQVGKYRVTHSWRIKSADQPLDLAVLAFSIGHPAMFRRLGFALRERLQEAYEDGYGHTQPLKLDDLINPPAGTVILNGMADADRYASTPEKGLEYVTAQIDRTLERE
jgi:hypothetical protein